MDMDSYLRFVFALIFVLALIALLAAVARRYGLGNRMPTRGAPRRLGLVETMALDPRRRLVLVQRDDVQHLLLLGHGSECVVETGIRPPAFTEILADTAEPTTSGSTKTDAREGGPS